MFAYVNTRTAQRPTTTKTPSGKRVVIYARMSKDATGEGLGIERQRDACMALCHSRGWRDPALITDNAVSASSDRTRPGFARLSKMMEQSEVDIIVVWNVDRLYRKPTDLESLIDLAERSAVTIVAASGDLDLSTPDGRMLARLLGAMARGEVEKKSARQKAANLQRVRNGGIANSGGRRTLGYTLGMSEVVSAEAGRIRSAFSDLLAGKGLGTIGREWNDAGFATSTGGTWEQCDVRVVLRNARYAGRATYLGEDMCEGNWPPLVTAEVFNAVRTILNNPARRTFTGQGGRLFLLPGLALCGRCAGPMKSGRTRGGERTYRCKDHDHLSVHADRVDEYVVGAILLLLNGPDAADLLITGPTVDTQRLRDEAAAQRQVMADLVDLHGQLLIDRAQLARGTDQSRRRLAELEAEMADAGRVNVLGPFIHGDAVEAWLDAGLETQRAVLDSLATITLYSPGRGVRTFRPETVGIDWK